MRIIKKIIRDIWGFSRSISEKHVPAYAAQAAYFIILSSKPEHSKSTGTYMFSAYKTYTLFS